MTTELARGQLAADMLAKMLLKGSAIIDAGAGREAPACRFFRERGMRAVAVDIRPPAEIIHDFRVGPVRLDGAVDALWSCHMLEHCINPGIALDNMRDSVRIGGVLAITVPPRKDTIVGGHVTLWNAGLLLYQLVCAGFDCSRAKVATYGYNVSVLVRRPGADVTARLKRKVDDYSFGHLDELREFLPVDGDAKRGHFDGNIHRLNWD